MCIMLEKNEFFFICLQHLCRDSFFLRLGTGEINEPNVLNWRFSTALPSSCPDSQQLQDCESNTTDLATVSQSD